MPRAIRLQLIISLVGSGIVAALIATLAYTSGVKTVPDTGGTYVEGIVGQPRFLNPLLASETDYAAQSIDAQIFSGLVREDETGRPLPDLAERWTISADGRTYIFFLRPNTQWQDGQPFSADDVIYTIGTIQSPSYGGDPDLAAAWRGVQISKLDDLTVEFLLPQPFAPILDYATVGILPAHLLSTTPPQDLPSSSFNRQPIGTGRYRLRELNLRMAILEASDLYYADKPYIARIMFRFYKDDAAALRGLRMGEVQGDWHVQSSDVPALERDDKVRLYRSIEPSFSGICFNLNDPVLGRPEVRQAIASAINREALGKQLPAGAVTPADSPIAPNSWAFDGEVHEPAYDPAQADATLQSSGWTKGPDGIWAREDLRLAPLLLTDDQPNHVALGNEIVRQLRPVGIDASIKSIPFDDLVKQYLVPREFQMALLNWDLPGADPDAYALWHSSQASPEGLNFSNWKSRTADELLETARKTSDMAKRKELYTQFQAVFTNELPAFLLFHPAYVYAVDSAVRGVNLPSVFRPSDRLAGVSQWYLRTKNVSPFFG